MTQVLVLSDAEVRQLLGMPEAISAVEAAFRELGSGRASMPAKTYLQFPEHGGDLRVMPASAGLELAGVKVVNSHAGNPRRGLPAVVATYVLVSQETGMPLALMGATYLTAVRTGAASAVATRYMARAGSTTVGLVGAGVQAVFQLEAVAGVLAVGRVLLWGPGFDRERTEGCAREIGRRFPGLRVEIVEELAAAAAAEVVCTTTPSRSPIVPDDAVRPGTHINAVGADGPGKQELDPAILRRARVVVDEWEQARHGGELNVPLAGGEVGEEQVAGSLAQVVAGEVAGRTSPEEVTVFDSTGLAIEDLAVASLVYRQARKAGRGTLIDL